LGFQEKSEHNYWYVNIVRIVWHIESAEVIKVYNKQMENPKNGKLLMIFRIALSVIGNSPLTKMPMRAIGRNLYALAQFI